MTGVLTWWLNSTSANCASTNTQNARNKTKWSAGTKYRYHADTNQQIREYQTRTECFKEVKGFLKIYKSLHTWFAAETHIGEKFLSNGKHDDYDDDDNNNNNKCKEIAVKLDNRHWYDHVPKSFDTSHEGRVTVVRNQQVRTDRTIPNNKPDNVIRDNKQCTLIDAAVPGDSNVIKREARKILKYKDHITDIQRMGHVTAKGIPVIIGATGAISKITGNKRGDWDHLKNHR